MTDYMSFFPDITRKCLSVLNDCHSCHFGDFLPENGVLGKMSETRKKNPRGESVIFSGKKVTFPAKVSFFLVKSGRKSYLQVQNALFPKRCPKCVKKPGKYAIFFEVRHRYLVVTKESRSHTRLCHFLLKSMKPNPFFGPWPNESAGLKKDV